SVGRAEEKASEQGKALSISRRMATSPVRVCHSLTVRSPERVAIVSSSAETASARSGPRCPRGRNRSFPAASHCQTTPRSSPAPPHPPGVRPRRDPPAAPPSPQPVHRAVGKQLPRQPPFAVGVLPQLGPGAVEERVHLAVPQRDASAAEEQKRRHEGRPRWLQ